MNSGKLRLIIIAWAVSVGFGASTPGWAQNDWADPVEKELPPKTTLRQPSEPGNLQLLPTRQQSAQQNGQSQNSSSRGNLQPSASRAASAQQTRQHSSQFGPPGHQTTGGQLQQPQLQFRTPQIPQTQRLSQAQPLPATEYGPINRNRSQQSQRGSAVQIPALTPANLFGVRMAAAQGLDIQIDTGEEVDGEELLAEKLDDVPDSVLDDDIYYEDEPISVADASLGDNLLIDDVMSDDMVFGDSSGCADCELECSTCGRSGQTCIRCRNGGLFVGGIGTYSIRPRWQTNPAFFVGNGATTAASTIRTGREFDWDTTLSPYAWLGVKGSSGFGLRARHWMFDNDSTIDYLIPAGNSIVSPSPGGLNLFAGPGSQIFAEHEMEFYSTDIEFSFEKQNEKWGIEGAAGLRYLDMDQHYLIRSTAPGGAVSELQTTHSFDGIGPTLLLKGNHALGLLGINMFASGRESILFGDRKSTAAGLATRSESGTAVVSITELEVGLQRVVWFRRISTDFQLAFVGQLWNGIGNAANAGLFDSSRDQNMGLFGGRASLGLNF